MRRRRFRWLMSTAAAHIAVAACVPSHPREPTPPPQIILTGARLQSFRGSALVAVGRAAQVTYQRTTADMTASEVLLRFPNLSANRPPGMFSNLEVRAPEMLGNLTSKQADGLDGVVVRSASGLLGRTERAHFDGASMTASGKDFVSVDGPKYSLTAKGFFIRFHDDTADFGNPVSSQLGGNR